VVGFNRNKKWFQLSCIEQERKGKIIFCLAGKGQKKERLSNLLVEKDREKEWLSTYFRGWKGQKEGTVLLGRTEKERLTAIWKGQKKERLTAVLDGKGKRRNG
jgi:hypothetical protein